MRTHLVFIVLLWPICVGCDDGKSDTVAVSELHEALENNVQSGSSGRPDFQEVSETPSSMVALMWDTKELNTDKLLDEITLIVKNNEDEIITIEAELVCSGLMTKTATLMLGTYQLDASESIPLVVKADALPIQNLNGASQVRVNLVSTREGPDKTFRQPTYSEPLYYRHAEGYFKVMIFDKKNLIEKKGGLLSGSVDPGADENEVVVLGRVSDGKGGFAEVTSLDESLNPINSDGTSGGRIIGMAYGREDENGNPVEVNNVQ